MPVYEFKCRVCETPYQSWRDTHPPMCPCGSMTKRVFSTFAVDVYQPHLAHDGSHEITSARQHALELRHAGEAQEERTGIPASFVPVHPADQKEVYGITDEGLDSTYRQEVAQGKRDVKLWL
jgi:putative FmdB family regulatory protein